MKRIYTAAAEFAQRSTTIADMRQAKRDGRKLVQTNANTAEEARAVEAAGIDMMICNSANAAVVRAANKTTFCTAALFLTEFPTYDDILREAYRVLHLGVDAVITPRSFDVVEKLAREGIPVMGHLGLVPRKSIWIGGLRAVGKTADEAKSLYLDFKRLENAGAFAVEAEVIAADVFTEIAKRTSLICVSLGSGTGGDVSFLFMNDLCGETETAPRHAHAFGNLAALHKQVHTARIDALKSFRDASLNGSFPAAANNAQASMGEFDAFLETLNTLD